MVKLDRSSDGQLINHILHDRYSIQSLLGRKTGRRTFLASDLATDLPVVIKLLLFNPDFTWDDLKLFEREAETLKALDHPAIPRYLDFFEVETALGQGFVLVQSYIEARSLQEWVQTGCTFSEAELKTIAKELLEILEYLHSRQPPVIHRDIKPSNVLLRNRSGNSPGEVYLVDFGSVQTVAHGGTMTVVGTYGYMPPEQFGGRSLPASDLYSVGATLIYLTTGQDPADLPQKDFRIEFEPSTSLSPSFIRWIQWLSNPHLSGRPTSAEAALEMDFYQHTPPAFSSEATLASNRRFSLVNHTSSKIQLQKTTTTLEVKVPRHQLSYPSEKGSSFWLVTLGFLIVIGCFGHWQWIIPGLIILPLFYSLFSSLQRLRKTDPYQVLFQLEGHSISVSLISSSANESRIINIISEGKLQALSAGSNLPKYQLNVSYYELRDAFHITGSRDEIQWLCDELNEWTGLEVHRWEPPSA